MDRLEAMTVLVKAVEAGSLSAAARQLGTPLPTVSRKISELEAYLNTSLLIRSRAGLTLTEAGHSFVAAARSILVDVTEAERAASGEYTAPTGELVVTAPIVFGRLHMLPVITDFLAAYPDVSVRLVQSDRIAHFIEEHIDVALRIGDLPDSELTATRLGEVRRVVCGAPDYFKRHGAPKTPGDLARHAIVEAQAMGEPGVWRLGRDEDRAVGLHSRLVVNTSEAAIDAAVAGVGLTRILSYQVADRVKEKILKIVLAGFEPKPWPVHLVYRGNVRVPLKLRAFMDFTAPRLRQRLGNARLS